MADWIADNIIASVMLVVTAATLIAAFAATRAMVPVSRGIDALSIAVGKTVMWLVLAAVLVSSYNAVQRYAFNVSSNAWLEIQWYLFGHIFFLAPFTILMVQTAVPWTIFSYARNELSTNAGGLIRWPAKSLLVLGFALLFAQALSEIIKRVAILRGEIEDPNIGHDAVSEIVETAKAMEGHGAPSVGQSGQEPGARP